MLFVVDSGRNFFFGDVFDRMSWTADGNDTGRQVLGDRGASANRCPVANVDIGERDGANSKERTGPYVDAAGQVNTRREMNVVLDNAIAAIPWHWR